MAKIVGLSKVISYIDDNLILASSELEAKLWDELPTAHFEGLGFTVNYNKSCLDPVQSTLFPVFNIDSRTMTVSVPSDKLARLRNTAKHPGNWMKCLGGP